MQTTAQEAKIPTTTPEQKMQRLWTLDPRQDHETLTILFCDEAYDVYA